MNLLNSEKVLIQILRYAPAVLIIILSLSITAYLTVDYTNKIELNKKEVKEEFIKLRKDRVQRNLATVSKYINNQYKIGLEETKQKVTNRVFNAHNITMGLYNKYKDTKSKEEITEIIKTALSNLRFDKNRGYFFIYERTGKNILNAEFRHLEGKNLWNFKDAKGAYLLKDMYKLLSEKEQVFYKWYWRESQGSDKVSQKLGLFKKFEPYDWFIGTGEYLDYYNQEIEKGILTYLQKVKYQDGGYIFVITQDGEGLISRNNAINGENIFTSSKFGIFAKEFKSFVDSKEQTRFIQYTTDFYGDTENIEKISFLKKFEKNNWVVGTGFHLKKVHELIEKKQQEFEKEKQQYISNLVVVSIVITIILLIISYFFSKYIEKLFFEYKKDVESKTIKLEQAHKIAKIGEWELDLSTMKAYWSPSVKEMIGVDQDIDASPKELKKIMHEDDWEGFENSLKTCVVSRKEHFVSYRIISPKDGKTRWFDCRGQLTEHNTVLGVLQDVTEAKEMQLEDDRKQNLIIQQSKMATMGEMINNIAHQWKQPLSTLSMLSGSIRVESELEELTNESLEKNLNSIDKSIQYLSQTIDDFRSYFKPENNKKSKLFVPSLVDKTLELISYRLKVSKIEVIKQMNNIGVDSIENQLVQVLINILNNAHDALIGNKDLFKKLIFIKVYEQDNKCIIEIYDNAGGIEESILNKVFDPYFSTKKEKGGTGIGLYMSQEIVQKLLEASLVVENKVYTYENIEYKGASFKIELPLE